MDQGWFSWVNPDVQPVEEPPSGPSGRQIGMVAIATLAIFAALIAFTVLGANNGGKGGALNPIARAAERTAEYRGERVAISGSYTYPSYSLQVQFHGDGAFNGETNQGRVTLHTDAAGPLPSFDLFEIDSGSDIYLSSPLFAEDLPAGKSWMKLSNLASGNVGTAASGQADPAEQLKMLEQVSDSFTVLGKETVRGHTTTHYAASISYQKAADQVRALGDDEGADVIAALAEKSGTTGFPAEVWIDSKGIVRRSALSIPIPFHGDQTFTMNMTEEYFDFGAKPHITVPPESQVFDATQIAEAGLKELTD